MNVIATREEFLRDAISAHDRVKTFTRRREEKLIKRRIDNSGGRRAVGAFSFSVAAVYDRRTSCL